MRLDVSWWDISKSSQTLESLRQRLSDECLERWARVRGLRLKLWISDPSTHRWGAIMLWQDKRPPSDELPPNDAQALISRPVLERSQFIVEACVEGLHSRRAPSTIQLTRDVERFASPGHHDYLVIDAFTQTALEGNPVAVFFGADDLSAEQMQRIGKEMNLSEVTFVLAPQAGGDARIRIFTPVNELPFAGHPMLGTALAVARVTRRSVLHLETAMGTIPMAVESAGERSAHVSMDQPIPTWQPYEHAQRLLEALGLQAVTLPIEAYRNGPRHVLVTCPNVGTLSSLLPNLRALRELPDMAAICVAPAGARWRCRMFSPAYGVAEDAATGSAAGPIAIHLARHGLAPFGERIEIVQGVEMGRPSVMYAVAEGKGENVTRARVSGHAILVAEGTLYV